MTSLLVGVLMSGSPVEAGITGSKHDFSAQTWVTNSEICVPCHTPHNANTTVTNAPLWNHATTAATFTVYSSATLNASVGQPSGISTLCLSCHDGTVAIDSYGGTTGTAMMTGPALVGIDLSNDHPISFAYTTGLATSDGGLNDPAVVNSGLGGTIQADMLFANSLECASCHDVHNAAGNSKLLRVSNTGSALCLTCHIK